MNDHLVVTHAPSPNSKTLTGGFLSDVDIAAIQYLCKFEIDSFCVPLVYKEVDQAVSSSYLLCRRTSCLVQGMWAGRSNADNRKEAELVNIIIIAPFNLTSTHHSIEKFLSPNTSLPYLKRHMEHDVCTYLHDQCPLNTMGTLGLRAALLVRIVCLSLIKPLFKSVTESRTID